MLKATGTELVRRASIEELAGHRQRALELYAQAYDTLSAAKSAWAKAVANSPGFGIDSNQARDLAYSGDRERWLESVRKSIDRSMWRHLIHATDLDKLMDRTARDQFSSGLEKDPPTATPDNVLATMSMLIGDADMIFRRGLIEAFRRLDNSYRSNDPFKVGPRAILTYAVSEYGGLRHGGYARDTILDIERVFAVMDGHPERHGELDAAIRTAHQEKKRECTTSYFRAKWFGNGNLHVYFQRHDLLEKANRMIAEHFGATLADAAA